MSETRNPSQHAAAMTVSDGSRGAGERQAAKAIALMNYAQALQECLEEQIPGTWPGHGGGKPAALVALDALDSVTSLLAAVGGGKMVDSAEFETVLNLAKAAFAGSGMIHGDRLS